MKSNFLLSYLFALVLIFSSVQTMNAATNTPQVNRTDLKSEAYNGAELSFGERLLLKLAKKRIEKAIKKAKVNNCAKIVTKDGDILEVELVKMGTETIEYKRCGKDDDFISEISLTKVFEVLDSKGESIFKANNYYDNLGPSNSTEGLDPNSKIHPLAIASFVIGILTFIVPTIILAVIFALLALIFGAVARKKIRLDPEQYHGKILAGIGMALGIIALGIVLLAGSLGVI